jgi:succinate---hydroxymethylglutarate CoA-transferase
VYNDLYLKFKLLAEKVLKRPELSDDPRFSSNDVRVANRTELVKIISGILEQQPRDYWLEKFRGLGWVKNFTPSYLYVTGLML